MFSEIFYKFMSGDYDKLVINWLMKASKPLLVGIALICIGSFGSNWFCSDCTNVGVILLIVDLIISMPRVLPKDHIVERWQTLISGAAGMGDDLITDVERRINETNAPGVRVERRNFAPGLIQCLLNKERLFLVVTNTANRRLRLHRLYISAENCGAQLYVSWFVASHPGFWQKITKIATRVSVLNAMLTPARLIGRYGMSKESAVIGLDLFDEQDLRAFVTNAHHCLLAAAKELGEANDFDTSGIDTLSRGFLGIS